eukprot:CAMPEP_0173105910 /NCGR_PEP_ID=MMETSP1102-20130122/40522_1 /TAXON_ID=49646 /ORGANISM="Geminigera sp., Strain Caron Lab Isolate" /LENGTH=277 /DNA_ID=CAMNT_0014002517 /DNA_START=182 /DNA_END=1012 /DNA_ORIENTATION=+
MLVLAIGAACPCFVHPACITSSLRPSAFMQSAHLGLFSGAYRSYTPKVLRRGHRKSHCHMNANPHRDETKQVLAFEPPVGLGEVESGALQLRAWMKACGDQNILVISGAGLSTESGIPDYRSPKGSYSKGHKPMQHDEFVGSLEGQQRYWARSMVGWKPFSRAQPNEGHMALCALEVMGVVSALVTQNVDGLHSKAGSKEVIDLHGRTDLVRCLRCGYSEARGVYQAQLEALNPHASLQPLDLRADGDAHLESGHDTFVVPPCPMCSIDETRCSIFW